MAKVQKSAIHPDAMKLPAGVQVQIRMNHTNMRVTGVTLKAMTDYIYEEGQIEPRKTITNKVSIAYGATAPLTFPTMESALETMKLIDLAGADLHEIVLAEI